MVSRQDATLNLSRLLSNAPGVDPEVEGEGLLAPTEVELREAALRLVGPLAWRVTVRSTGGDADDFLAEGEVSGTAVMECRRCLTDVETAVESSFLYPMVYRPGREAGLTLQETPLAVGAADDEDGEDVLAFGKPEVDFAPLLRQVFAIDLPLTALCREECRGLATDGVNLNEYPDHVPEEQERREEGESPFSSLRDLDLDLGSDS